MKDAELNDRLQFVRRAARLKDTVRRASVQGLADGSAAADLRSG